MTVYPRRAFTLVELLVVMAIIGVLVALLLPAVGAAREASRRLQCGSQLRQLGIALHGYHDQRGAFPLGQRNWIGREVARPTWNRACWWQEVLPFVEQQALYDVTDAYMRNNSVFYVASAVNNKPATVSEPGRNTIVRMFVCPSDGNGPKNRTVAGNEQGFHGNYVLCGGSTAFNPPGDPLGIRLGGMFFPFSQTSFASATDGMSCTLLGSETLVVPDGNAHDLRGRYWNSWQGNTLFSALHPPNAPDADRSNWCIDASRRPCTLTGVDVVQSARSNHPGGVNALLGDASVRFVSNTVNLSVYRAAATRGGGETEQLD